MSSTYRRICLNHKPPLVLPDDEFRDRITGDLPHEDHQECKMAAGRYSYPIIEVWLPDRKEWVDVDWMRRFPDLARAILDGKV